MQRKICPICDTKLAAGNFCPVCRRWVRKPFYMDVDYYLNERHPEYEDKCEYHNAGAYEKKEDRRKPARLSAGPGRTEGHSSHLGRGADRPNRTAVHQNQTADRPSRMAGIPTRPAENGKRKKKSSAGSLFIVIAAVMIINVVVGLSGSIRGLLEDFGEMVHAGGMKETTEKVELIEDPVIGDERCNGFNHFPAVLEDVHPAVESWLKEHGYEIAEMRTDVSNQEMRTESHTTTYYASTDQFVIQSDTESLDSYVEIAYDSVTEEIHALRSVLKTREEAESLWEAVGPVLGISLNMEEIRNREPDEDEWIWTEGDGYTTLLYYIGEEDDALYGVVQPY
ncbi:hypothetical protein [Clostridium sp. AM58-1XD]|uniref:hypothetical protein n=1 Tax=Clostridium sp. AM58-1XD TaxID=2292307 RepID=UPI000E4865A7|nr:hypothetical protein [Clostridium sp. AM58-1XD]RGY99659.1 hypothetical protein DXA13_07430 [Clostridium sp. AM58-1XD]